MQSLMINVFCVDLFLLYYLRKSIILNRHIHIFIHGDYHWVTILSTLNKWILFFDASSDPVTHTTWPVTNLVTPWLLVCAVNVTPLAPLLHNPPCLMLIFMSKFHVYRVNLSKWHVSMFSRWLWDLVKQTSLSTESENFSQLAYLY